MKFDYLFPERLRQARLKKDLTQKQICDMMGKHSKILSGYEHGHRIPTIKIMIELAEILDVHPGWLLGDVVKKEKQ